MLTWKNIDLTNGLNGTDINTDINRTEEFIDAAYDNLKYDVLKNKIFNDLKVELRQLLQVEVKAFLNEDRGELKMIVILVLFQIWKKKFYF